PGQHVLGHVLLVPDRAAARDRAGQHGGDIGRVVVLRGDHLVASGVLHAGGKQVVRVERLVDDGGVLAVFPRAHHRGGDVARARPHRDALPIARQAHTRGSDRLSVFTSSMYSCCRRSTTGPRPPLPMRRPSISLAGTTPAKVPVTKASSAPWTSVRLKFFSNTGMPLARHNRITLARVMPPRQ